MEYRHLTHAQRGYESEEDELADMREHVQSLMFNTEPEDIVDGLLIVANVCENRALICLIPERKRWYERTARMLRGLLDILSKGDPKPFSKYEQQYLYYPHTEIMH